jgi:hypothetical protein
MDVATVMLLITAGLAMAALGNICSTEMGRDLTPDIERILENGSPYMRKKAALCAIRCVCQGQQHASVGMSGQHRHNYCTGCSLQIRGARDRQAFHAYAARMSSASNRVQARHRS